MSFYVIFFIIRVTTEKKKNPKKILNCIHCTKTTRPKAKLSAKTRNLPSSVSKSQCQMGDKVYFSFTHCLSQWNFNVFACYVLGVASPHWAPSGWPISSWSQEQTLGGQFDKHQHTCSQCGRGGSKTNREARNSGDKRHNWVRTGSDRRRKHEEQKQQRLRQAGE